MGDVTLECGDGVPGRLVTPQFLDEQLGGHHTAEAYEQQGEQGSPTWRAERQIMPVVSRRHGPQNAQEELSLAGRPG
ncbi:hypothetical protein AR457_00870 [Streptomyces agglomeratus]|uniref:Uncharacterized protein n=1 Tax=Streptomyces agglomeratus TaxID=285458 RepID=A0A1E5P194_9ACTN|nr:hypothetical protein AS594_01060 [Streptomyces agglomeratus]OEJ42873.1 hypothetical protein AR457_00870 [Streptomyces agglomeratus]OEJ55192.1 hypothetical protein BGK72_34830 [Streptomyces agglomeratus]OEJ62566.1 hypothetical protein BGM19_35815 [Streptomyces agglomeratus]